MGVDAHKKRDKGGAMGEPHDYQAKKPILEPLFKGEIDYLFRMIRMREIYAIELMLQPLGLTLSAWYPLAVLRVEEGLTQRELGSRLNLKDAATGKAIDALERAGLVTRENDPTDRRKALVCLTDEGRKIAKTVGKMRKDFQSIIVDGFSDKERETLRELLERSYENIGKFIASHH